MLWMETHFLYCSVRLGVIVVGVLTFLSLFIPDIMFWVLGIRLIDPWVKLFQNDDYYKKQAIVITAQNWIKDSPQNCLIVLHLYLAMHMITCVLVIYGAAKLKKWFLLPFIIIEFVRVIYCLALHIVLMIVLKKIIYLGGLITLTLAGGFFILYLGYNWATCVALFQIINLIHTQRYKALYGNDPYHPQLTAAGVRDYGSIENVRVLLTPNPNEIDELKHKNSNVQQSIISVQPVNYNQELLPMKSNKERVRKQNRWNNIPKQKLQEMQTTNKEQQREQPNTPDEYYYNDMVVDYGNWQWSELMGGVKKQNPLINTNWKRY